MLHDLRLFLAHAPSQTPSQPSRRKVEISSDALARCRDVLTALQLAGQACPLLPLQGAAGLACMIVQAVQGIENQRRACRELAEKAVKMVLAMADELAHGGFNEHMRKRITAFSE
ncbi:hypothetical protein FRB96_009483 [Tulasnella sp. 330]|nr:hypothetical protein FRB96_009483 [Tulasnella sp. 330]